uniref:Genome polyprotein n=1 Tax=Hepacivirus myodae TaxID=3052232 RepID=A0A6B9PQ84_9FLAV|nr:polyprotein [Hepacivirus myodae]
MVGKGRPRGKVVKGVYVVHPKKTVDHGARRKPRQRRDQGGWRRSAIGPLDPYARLGMQALLPSPAYPSRDPRRQSRFLGHIIDGTLGWATDVIHHIPLVGPLLGHPCRVVCRVVRAGENAVNAITGTVGVHLFVLALLAAMLAPSGAVTNCCSADQVTYCTEVTCVHESGCAICQLDGNQTICWEPQGLMVSHHPNYTGVDTFLSHHIDLVAGTVFVCDLAGVKEVCGTAVLLSSYALTLFPRQITLNPDADCFLLVESGVNPLFNSFFYWVAEEFNTITALIDFIGKIPVALAHAFTQSHFITMCSIAGLALNGNMVKALALTALYIEAAAAASLPTVDPPIPWNGTCPMNGTIPVCGNITAMASHGDGYCFNPRTGFRPLRAAVPIDGWFCVWVAKGRDTIRTEPACCTLRSRPSFCQCSTDCSWWDERQTFEACGASVILSIACSGKAHKALASVLPTIPPTELESPPPTCWPTPVAMLDVPGQYWGPQWRRSSIILSHGFQIGYWFNEDLLSDLAPSHWARLPGTPLSYKGSWMLVPRGMYSSRKDISSGLIMKDKNHQDYQLLYSGVGAYILPGITAHVVIIALLAALGARWCLLFYALVNLVPQAFAFTPEIVAATASSPWPSPAVRLFVFLASLYREPLALPLSGSITGLFLSSIHLATAYSLNDVMLAVSATCLFAGWVGLVSPYIPWLVLTQSYLRVRLEAFCHQWIDRSVLLLCVLVIPHAVWNACLAAWICWAGLVIGGQLAVQVLGPKDKVSLKTTLERVDRCWHWLAQVLRPIVIWAAGERGVFWYEHMDGQLHGKWEFKDPYYPFETEVIRAADIGMKLACGDQIRGLPVSARLGTTVQAGIGQIPRGWERTAPFSFKTTHHRSQLRALAMCVTGSDQSTYKGSVAIMGTPLRSWMGFGCNGALYTVFHGSRGRNLAGKDGPMAPRLVDATKDLVKYPLPTGFTNLECTACNCTEFFLLTKAGRLVPCVRAESRFVNTGALTLREAKGSSGAPILCKCGKVKAMFLSCRSARGIVSSLGVLTINPDSEVDTRQTVSDALEAPTVPKQGKEVKRLVAPTGSGKTTKLPMQYYKDGYTVLVLNPSVATTRSVPKYMKEAYGVSPNVLTGDHCVRTGSRLTYSTYGMFLTQPHIEADVVICDEVHSVDSTTILGIGSVLRALESSAKCKLVILATATPPGTSMQPHSNITTVDLSDDGEFPFHGKKIKLDNLKAGRHLIFTPSKKHCEHMAKDLKEAGIQAVAYYRGKDAQCIPETGDIVVVATDALMTGYTGNFDSVYDSCLSVVPKYEVTMNPTFEVGIQTVNSDTVTRMQRRGRTGRGRPGTYYQVTPHAQALGTVPPANVLEAFDSGLAYFGMTPAEVATALSFYKEEPLTPSLEVSLEEMTSLFITVGFVEPAYIEIMKQRAENYTYLYAAQYQLAKRADAQAPNDNPIWRGLRGRSKFPILYDLEEYDSERVVTSALAERLAACYEEYFASTTVTLAGVGLASAAVFAAVDLLGNIIIKRVWEKTSDSTAARVVEFEPLDTEEVLEECYQWDGFAEAVNRASSWLGDKIVELGIHAGGAHPWQRTAQAVLPHLLAGIQYFAGLCCLQDAPGLGSVLGFVGGVLSPLPLKASLFLAALGGAFASRLTTQRGAAAFALAGALGAGAGALGIGSLLASTLTTYGGATATCLVVLKLIDGQLPEVSELASLAFNLACPGAVIVGAASAVMIAYCTRTESQAWMNRLLAMLNKGTSCEDYFVAATTLRKSVIHLLEKANLWAVFTEIASWLNRTDEEDCSCRGAFLAFYDAVGRLLRLIVEFARGFVRRVLKVPSIPYATCDKGYSGPWAGNGIVNTTCQCGAEQVWNIIEGKAQWVGGSKLCSSWLTGRVPVNSALTGCARPRPASWKTMAVNTGFNSYVVYERRHLDVYVIGCSNIDQVVAHTVPDLLSAVMVDGVQVKPFGGTDWKKVGPYRCRLQTPAGVQQVQIPFKLEPHKDPYKEEYTPPPSAMGQLAQTERCFSLTRARRLSDADRPSKKESVMAESDDENEGAGLIRGLASGWAKLLKQHPEQTRAKEEGAAAAEPEVRQRKKALEAPVEGIEIAREIRPPQAIVSQPVVRPKVKQERRPPSGESKPTSPITFGPPKLDQMIPWGFLDPFFPVGCILEEEVALHRLKKALAGPPRGFIDPFFPCGRVLSVSKFGKQLISLEVERLRKEGLNPAAPVFVPKKKVNIVAGARPLPKTPPKGATANEADTFSLHESSWDTEESQEHECAAWSYTWTIPTLVYKGMRRAVAAVSTYTSGIMRYKHLAYATEPSSINERIKKVTIMRTRQSFPELEEAVRAAKARARRVQGVEMTIAEALDITANKTAKSGITGMTAKDLKAGKTGQVQEIYDLLGKSTIEQPWNQVNIMPKSEVFVKTPQKPNKKPARIIAYPHLEMRVAEKMVLGNIGPATVKAVCGDAYGFVPPKERVQKLLKMWDSKAQPAGFTCDTVCFDSTITPEDVAVERDIYCEAASQESTKVRIRTLHDGLYSGGPMVMQGVQVGERHCRASGVFTTSSSNTMTCFLKVSAAARKAGIKKPSWLICGDDTVCIFESQGLEDDTRRLGLFATYMGQMGAPQGEVPRPHYSLELLDSCSSNISSAQTRYGLYHYMTRDPRIPFARISLEGKGFNPLGSMLGYILANYPAIWVSRVIAVKFMQELLALDHPTSITFDWYGNNYTVPVSKIPYIIQSLHGKQAWTITQYTSREVSRVAQSLKDNTMRPLRYYKRTARSIVASARRRGGVLAFLANTLLAWVHGTYVNLEPKKVEMASAFNFFEPYSQDIYDQEPRRWGLPIYLGLFAGIAGLLALCLHLV